MLRVIVGTGAGFLWGSVSLFLLMWATDNDQMKGEEIVLLYLGGGPFAAVGAILGLASVVVKHLRDQERY